MQSEHSSIDELFRKKEETALPPGNRQEAHWLQMKAMLAAPGITPPRKRGRIISRRIFMYTSGIVIITVIVTTLLLNTARNGRTKNVAAVKAIPATAVSHHRPQQKNKIYTIVTVTSRYIPGVAGGKPVKRNAGAGYAMNASTAKTPYLAPADTATSIPVKEAPDAAALLNRFYSQLQQEPQEFLVNTFRDTLLVAKQGTRLLIPSRAFVSKTGKAITGTVKIVLEEFYNYDKMIAAGLGTTSNGEQLVSGGMLHIMALSDGHELLLQPSINITVKMPTNNYDGRMQLFTGNIPQKASPARSGFIDAAQVSFHDVGDTSAYTPPPAPCNKEINWLAAGQWQQSYSRPDIKVWDLRNDPDQVYYRRDQDIAIFYIHRRHGPDKDIIKKELQKRYGYYYNKIKVKSTDAVEVGLFKPRKISIVGDSVNMSFDEAIKNKLVSPSDSLAYINRVIADSIAYFTKAGKLKDYTFNISNLGWINCDRFSKDPRPRVELVVNLGPGANASLFHSQLVFTRYQSLVPGYYHDTRLSYGKIPNGEPVTLVCLGVKDGKVVSCIESFTASAVEINNLRFEETTPEQFKSKLKALNLNTQ